MLPTPRTRLRGWRTLRALLAGSLAGIAVLMGATTAQAADEASIAYVGARDGGLLQLLVSVPTGSTVDLDEVSRDDRRAGGGGHRRPGRDHGRHPSHDRARHRHEQLHEGPAVRAGQGGRATCSSTTVPDDVYVGIVTFDSDVETPLTPSRDRDQARTVVDGLTLAKQTSLYDGVLAAVELTGVEGQRSVLVLSDGADTSDTELADVTAAIADSEVLVDVVAIDQTGRGPPGPRVDGRGRQRSGDQRGPAERCAQTFADEAEALASQVLVTARIPESVVASEAEVTVSLPVGTEVLTATAFATIAEPQSDVVEEVFERSKGLALPAWTMYAAVGMVGVGLVVLLIAAVPGGRAGELSAEAVVGSQRAGRQPARPGPEVRPGAGAGTGDRGRRPDAAPQREPRRTDRDGGSKPPAVM